MSESLTIEFVGDVPSKKNSRITLRSGRSIPGKKYQQWHEYAIFQIKSTVNRRPNIRLFEKKPMSQNIAITFYMGTRRRTDIDNKISSILDTLVDAGVLEDDDWTHVPSITARAIYRKGESGATVTITPLENCGVSQHPKSNQEACYNSDKK